MSDTATDPTDPPTQTPTPDPQPTKPVHVSFSIWPPTQRTRDAVTDKLVTTLSTPSILSKRYGTVPHDEAADVANRIEAEAFEAAGGGGGDAADGDGLEVLQAYSKEISRRMLEAIKSRSDRDGESVGEGVGDGAGAEEVEA